MAKFPFGETVITPGALDALSAESVRVSLGRHAYGDWGELEAEDKRANDRALTHGGRLFSAYIDKNGVKFWIITEADRSVTRSRNSATWPAPRGLQLWTPSSRNRRPRCRGGLSLTACLSASSRAKHRAFSHGTLIAWPAMPLTGGASSISSTRGPSPISTART